MMIIFANRLQVDTFTRQSLKELDEAGMACFYELDNNNLTIPIILILIGLY